MTTYAGKRNPFYGKTHTAETRALIAERSKEWWKENPGHNPRRNKPLSLEEKKRFSQVMRGRKHSVETREKMRLAHLGRKHTPETRRKISVAHNRYFLSGKAWQSSLEKRGRVLLKRYGLGSRIRIGDHVYDAGSKTRKIIVEVDGCYPHDHRCTIVNFRRGPSYARKKDLRLTQRALIRGYRVLRLLECEENQWHRQLKEFLSNV